jgi:hypothetical protein
MAMTEAVSLAAAHTRIRSIGRRGAARLVAWASDDNLSPWLVAGFIILHAGLWTLILMRLRAAQDVHFDVAEAFAGARNSCLATASIPRCRDGSPASGSGCSQSRTGRPTRSQW